MRFNTRGLILSALLFSAITAVFFVAFNFFTDQKQTAGVIVSENLFQRTVELRGQTIHVSIANTPQAHEAGLGGRTGLAPDEGMLFIFREEGKHVFWMKDMSFPIDIVWIASDGRVVYLAQNVSPDTYPMSFVSTAPARYVLELPAGFSSEYAVIIGDIVRL